MSARLVIDYIREQQGIKFNTLVDTDFSQISWLTEREPTYSNKGEKISKSYYYNNKKEAIRITYHKLFETYNGFEDVFIGLKKVVHWIDWAGEIGASKNMQPYYFELIPTYDLENVEVITGYTSLKQREVLSNERRKADAYLQAHNPEIYFILFDKYNDEYIKYLATGDSTDLKDKLETEVDTTINSLLDKSVVELVDEDITVRDLIILNLQ